MHVRRNLLSESLVVLSLSLVACEASTPPTEPAGITDAVASAELPVLSSARVMSEAAIRELPSEKQFSIELRFVAPMSPSQEAIFRGAGARWARLIVGDVPSITGTIPANFCGLPGVPAFTGTIDDILIDVVVTAIDGPGRILGAAGPCAIRRSDDLPAYGIMFFDVADLGFIEQFGVLDEVIVHEMGHVLGIGTLWNFNRQLRVGDGTPDPRFVGRHAIAMYRELGGQGTIPIEGDFGAGTAGGHWDEDAFETELMTGFVALGSSPLSRMTTTSLKDLGYVTAALGDPYELPTVTGAAIRNGAHEGVSLDDGELLIAPQAYIK